VLNAQEVARAALALKNSGFVPDVMLGHNGWGEIWYLKDVFPDTPLIGYFEFFYRFEGADIEFELGVSKQLDTAPRIRTKNLGNLLGLEAADLGRCPTRCQQSLYPERCHSMLRVIHEGIDTRVVTPEPRASLRVPNLDRELQVGDEVLTYVARNLEPYRGFASIMRSLPSILSRRPNAHGVIVGGDDVSYGSRLPDGKTYRQEMFKELGGSVDLTRVHFLGKVPYPTFLKVLQVSRAHVYVTYPSNAIADTVVDALANPEAYKPIRERARRTIIDNYDLSTITLPAQMKLLREAAEPAQYYLWKRARK
jgi:glycosyltransferase involved in cell wall biosynthesis